MSKPSISSVVRNFKRARKEPLSNDAKAKIAWWSKRQPVKDLVEMASPENEVDYFENEKVALVEIRDVFQTEEDPAQYEVLVHIQVEFKEMVMNSGLVVSYGRLHLEVYLEVDSEGDIV